MISKLIKKSYGGWIVADHEAFILEIDLDKVCAIFAAQTVIDPFLNEDHASRLFTLEQGFTHAFIASRQDNSRPEQIVLFRPGFGIESVQRFNGNPNSTANRRLRMKIFSLFR